MKSLSRILITLALSAVAFAASAQSDVPPNVPKNIRYQAAVGACQPDFADFSKFASRFNGLSIYNNAPGTLAVAKCAPLVDVSDNGTEQIGLYVSNNDGGKVAVTASCFLSYNTAGSGARYAQQTITVQPALIGKLSWNTSGIVFGGPVTIVCDLPYKAGVMRVFTISQHSS